MQLSADQIQNEAQTRVHNLKIAYEYVDKITATPNKLIQENWFKELHKMVCQNINSPANNMPGEYRNEIKGFPIRVGDENHGGVYKPPQSADDVAILIKLNVVTITESGEIIIFKLKPELKLSDNPTTSPK